MTAMTATFLIGIFGLLAFLNLACWVSTYVTRKYSSTIPLIGGVSGCIGFLLLPKLRAYALLPLFLDVGTATLILVAPKICRELWQTSRFNLLKEYIGRKSGQKNVTIKLFKRGILIIEQSFVGNKFDRADNVSLVHISNLGEWAERECKLEFQIAGKKALFAIAGSKELEKIWQIEGFDYYEKDEATSLKNIEFTLTAQ